MCPKFHAAPFLSSMKVDPEPFDIVPLQPDLDEARVAVEGSWYDHSSVATLRFEQQDPQRVQLPIGDSVARVRMELHLLQCLKHKKSVLVPLIPEVLAASPPKPKKKRTLMKVADVAFPPPPTATLPPPPPSTILLPPPPIAMLPPPPPPLAAERQPKGMGESSAGSGQWCSYYLMCYKRYHL